MGNQNLIWETFVANVERCPIGYEIRRVFTQPGSEAEVTNTQNLSMRTAATWCKADIVTQELSRSRSLGAR